jgi:glutamine synthetase
VELGELRQAVADGAVETVAICTPDLNGKLMGKRVPARRFLEHLPAGIEISCSIYVYDDEQNVLEGFPEIGEQNGWADMAASPDLVSLRRLAHLDRAALVFADVRWSPARAVEISPREVLRRQVERARAAGVVPVAALEYEFYLFAETFESARAKGYRGIEPLHATAQDYGLYRADRDEALLGELRRALDGSEVPVESVKTEIGPAQYELTVEPCDALGAADRGALLKQITREVAAQHDLAATFMARLDHREAGNSGHVHLSVADDAGTNLFDDGSGLSPLARRFCGGLMRRAPELQMLACPYVNSYKRLDPANFVTATLDFGHEGRTTPFRICGRGASCNVEYRIPGADANPYLVLAAMLAAGLDGLEHGAEPFVAGSAEARAVGDLPASLPAAIERFAGSAFMREVFGDLVVDTLVAARRHEVDAHAREVADVELRRGFEWA